MKIQNRNPFLFLGIAAIFLTVGAADGLLRYLAEQNRPDGLPFFSAMMTKMPGWFFAALTLPVVLFTAKMYDRSKRHILAHASVLVSLSVCVLFVISSATLVTQYIRGREFSWGRTTGIIFEEIDELFFVALGAYVAFFFGALFLLHQQRKRDESSARNITDTSLPGRIPLRTGRKTVFVDAGDIDWIESAGNYVTIHCGTAQHLVRDRMKNFEGMLEPGSFFRAHRTVLVNMNKVREIRRTNTDAGALILHDGTELPMSRARREELEQRLADHGFGQ